MVKSLQTGGRRSCDCDSPQPQHLEPNLADCAGAKRVNRPHAGRGRNEDLRPRARGRRRWRGLGCAAADGHGAERRNNDQVVVYVSGAEVDFACDGVTEDEEMDIHHGSPADVIVIGANIASATPNASCDADLVATATNTGGIILTSFYIHIRDAGGESKLESKATVTLIVQAWRVGARSEFQRGICAVEVPAN